MVLVPVLIRCLAVTTLAWGWCGCGLAPKSSLDERKDPHFLAGKNRANGLDYRGAAEAFEKALETNPRSASAHFELGFLYMQRLTNYAAAIYHFERFLGLRPQSEHAEWVRGHITGCKQELARTVPLGPVTPPMQRDLARLADENLRLRQQVDFLNRRLAEATNSWTAPMAMMGSTSVSPALLANPVPGPPSTSGVVRIQEGTRPPLSPAATNAVSSPPRVHVLQRNETMASVARKYRIQLSALQAANPRLDPRRLRIGQRLVIPPK